MENIKVNRKNKDVLFRMIFKEKDSLLELYNAVNGTSYTNEEDLEIVTLEDAIYMNVKNDVAFLIGSQINLYEHQSTWNPNMPVRCLIYIAKEYSKLIDDKSIYSRKLQKIPTPRFIVFYNGEKKQPEKKTLNLSSAFEIPVQDPELELKTTVYNINLGKNRELMEQCRRLEEYAIFVDKLRRYTKINGIEKAAEITVDECIRENILKDILEKNRAEVIEMSIFYYDQDKEIELIRKDEYEMGKEDGRMAGKAETAIHFLRKFGDVPEKIYRVIMSERDENILMNWIFEAAKAKNMEEFLAVFERESRNII